MAILGIDSSDEFLAVGLADDNGIMISRSSEIEKQNKNMLHRFIEDLFKDGELEFAGLSGVAVALGPGSFTGLRVGLAVAKGICWSLGLPLTGVSSLGAIAVCADPMHDKILPVKDAKCQEFYYAAFERKNGHWHPAIPDSVGGVDAVVELIDSGYRPIGPGIDALKSQKPDLELAGDGYDRQKLGGAIAVMGLEMIKTGQTLELADAAPNYIRTPRPKEWKP